VSINDFGELIRSLRYIPDPDDFEEMRAPWIVFEQHGGDCDDVAILSAIWAHLKGYRWRWLLWGQDNLIYHISTEIKDIAHIDPFGSKRYKLQYCGKWN